MPGRGRGEARGRGAARPGGAVPPQRRPLLPVPDRGGAVGEHAVVREDEAAGRPRHPRGARGRDPDRPGAVGEDVLRVDGEYPRLVHLPADLVGASHPGVPLPRVREDDGRDRTAFAVRGVRGDRHPAGRGRSRHLVLLRPLAVLDPRVARKDGGSRTVLPHVRAGDGIRHPLLLGRADDDDGDRVHGESSLPRRGDPRPRPGRQGREDEQDAGERHRPPRRDRPVRHRRLPLHPRRAGRPGAGHPDVRRPGRGVPQLHEQAVPGGPLRPDARRRRDAVGASGRTCR